ncbi:MAG: ATP-dependent helicase C-terminal domain-containing protein, partial [Pseudomonadota bacterium]
DPSSGMARLVTEPASQAEAVQRAGRAGRVAPGQCFRLWTSGEAGARPTHAPPEIERTDLAGLALELALWGAEPDKMPFLTPPHSGTFAAARRLLALLSAVNPQGQITDHGRALAALPLHPRLAHMLVRVGPRAALLAGLLAERDPMPRGAPVDLGLRLATLRGNAEAGGLHPAAAKRIRAEAKRLARGLQKTERSELNEAQMAALAYPDRIGLRRKGGLARYVLSGGKGAFLTQDDPLALARLIVVSDLDGTAREARIRQAIEISEAELREIMHDKITWHEICRWDTRENAVRSRREERFGALVLDDRVWKDPPKADIAQALLDGIRALGLPWSDASRRFAARVRMVAKTGADLPDLSDTALMQGLDNWLLPFAENLRSAEDLRKFDILPALRAMLDWSQMHALDEAAPAHFMTPLGRRIPIDYSLSHPAISLRLQELFGVNAHPVIAGLPLRVTLLSPAGRPVQTTMDLPGFWASSYADVRKDMRGRYPKHAWPEDPSQADPTLRAKPRKANDV